MKAKFGSFLMAMGSVLLVAALALFLYNRHEGNQAAQASAAVMPVLVEEIRSRQTQPTAPPTEPVETDPVPTLPQKTMPPVKINGYNYIGFVGIPALELELPILEKWDYKRLNIAPCRYWGDMYTDDLVVMAHNYPNHFGKLSDLRSGDTITVTDMDAETLTYCVSAIDILPSNGTEELLNAEYDLTLFTCTYGGENRVVVRCDRVAE